MSGIAFGKTLRYLRKRAKIPSKNLSMQAGKAATYVSQLERGLIKNPNNDTCRKLLELVGLEPDSIEKVLNRHGLMDGPHMYTDGIDGINQPGPGQPGSPLKAGNNPRIYDGKYRDTKDKNYNIYCVFDSLADTDITRGSLVINIIYNLTRDENNLDFLCDLLAIDYAQLTPKLKAEILVRIGRLLRGSKADPIVRLRVSKV